MILNGYANGANGKVGFCYSATNESPDPETCACVETSSIMLDNSYQITVDGLMPATKYYYRAFATKDQMRVMAKEVKSFMTNDFNMVLMDAEDITYSSVVLKAQANDDSYNVGFCFSATKSVPTRENAWFIGAQLQKDSTYMVFVDGLAPATTYYYRSYAWKNGIILYSNEIKTFTTEEFKQEAVDLGLSVKWSNCNLGAYAPEEYGDYFAWGETAPKEYYAWSTYFDTTDDGSTFTKYNNDGGLTVLEPADDAATANLGDDWRMPTKEEIDELNNNCTCCWTTLNGVRGYKVIGKNGNSIFFPASGYRFEDYVDCEGVYGSYWSSTLSVSHTHGAYDFYFYTGYIDCYSGRRCGRPVRAVCK